MTTIKHWLLPSKKNKYHPHALRPVGLSIALVALLIIPIIYNAISAQKLQILGYATSISSSSLNTTTNNYRSDRGLKPLTINSLLNSAALAKANDMMADDYWAHVAPDGTTPWSFIVAAGYDYTMAGENLAKGFYDSVDVVNAWMASQTHKDNLLNPDYQEVGYAVVNGSLSGDDVTLVVAMYGTRYVAPTVAEADQPKAVAVTEDKPQSSKPAAKPDAQQVTPANPTVAPTEEATQIAQDAQTSPSGQSEVLGSLFSQPIKAYQSLNWGQKASVLLVSALVLLLIMKHTLIWRQQRRGFKHIWLRSHPIGQASMLVAALILTLASGTGVIL